MPTPLRPLVVICLFGLFSTGLSAATYKFTDSDGNVTYSNTPPSGGRRYEKVPSDSTHSEYGDPGTTDSSASSPGTSGTGSAETGGGKETLKKEMQKNQALREQNCEAAKKNLEAYTVYRRIRDKDGNTIILDDNERAKKIEESQKQVEDYCN
ncbi:MAG: DUF4124 domain-containing protein [Gammaproteobacteria bacterium]|nr:DUF4124 domain-containing protein [Gammaproteobacteria bacterium]